MREINYWNNKENCIVEAKKYNTITELQKHCYGCYMGLKRNDWLYEVFPLKNKAVGYWNNLDNLIKEASKYKTKKEFRKHCKSGYNAALRNNYITYLDDNLFIKEDKRFNEEKNKNHLIYVYEIKDYNTCYVGQTINLHERDMSHRRGRKHSDGRITYDGLYMFCKHKNINIPSPIIKEYELNAKESLIKEDDWLNFYKENGWNVLNIAKTGEFSGSIGSNKIWTYERCKEFCKNYLYKNELRKANYQCYYVCLTNDWFDEFGILDKKIHKNGYWNNKDRCIKVARSCKDKTDFIVNHQGAYKSAVRNQWIKEINDLFAKS